MITCIFFSVLFFSGHMTLDCFEGTCLQREQQISCKLLGNFVSLCCSFGNTTDGRETTVGIRREVVYCGELKDGGPVFIYIYIHTPVYYPVNYCM